MASGGSNLDLAINALVLIRNAQRAIDTALRLPAEDRAAVADQVEAVRRSAGKVGASLATTIPGAQSLAGATQVVGGSLAQRPELRTLGGVVSFFAKQGSEVLGAVAGAAGSLGGGRDRSLALSERIVARLGESGVATREDLARELDVEVRSPEFQDALERTLGSGRAEWYGPGTYGLPRDELEVLIGRARGGAGDGVPASEPDGSGLEAEASADAAGAPELGDAVSELSASLSRLRGAVSERRDEEPPPGATS